MSQFTICNSQQETVLEFSIALRLPATIKTSVDCALLYVD